MIPPDRRVVRFPHLESLTKGQYGLCYLARGAEVTSQASFHEAIGRTLPNPLENLGSVPIALLTSLAESVDALCGISEQCHPTLCGREQSHDQACSYPHQVLHFINEAYVEVPTPSRALRHLLREVALRFSDSSLVVFAAPIASRLERLEQVGGKGVECSRCHTSSDSSERYSFSNLRHCSTGEAYGREHVAGADVLTADQIS